MIKRRIRLIWWQRSAAPCIIRSRKCSISTSMIVFSKLVSYRVTIPNGALSLSQRCKFHQSKMQLSVVKSATKVISQRRTLSAWETTWWLAILPFLWWSKKGTTREKLQDLTESKGTMSSEKRHGRNKRWPHNCKSKKTGKTCNANSSSSHLLKSRLVSQKT